MSVSFDFSGKIVLVTGGSQGIGLATAHGFRDAGATVHVTGTRTSIDEYGGDFSGITYHRCLVQNAADRDAVSEQLPDLDVLVNNAGFAGNDEYEIGGFRNVMAVNVEAVAALCYAFKDRLAQSRGAIVNTASVASYIALNDRPAYTASKHALLGLTKALGDRWAKRGIRVNAVAPGFVDTQIIEWAKRDDEFQKSMLSRVPAARFGQPAEVAQAILFLSSDAAAYIVGHGLVIDGGFTLR